MNYKQQSNDVLKTISDAFDDTMQRNQHNNALCDLIGEMQTDVMNELMKRFDGDDIAVMKFLGKY